MQQGNRIPRPIKICFSQKWAVCVNIFLWIRPRQPLWSIIHRPLSARDSRGWQIPHDKGINDNQLLWGRLGTHLLQMHLLGQLTTCHELLEWCSPVPSKENGEDKEIKNKKQLVVCMVCFIPVRDHKSNGFLSYKHFLHRKAKSKGRFALNLISELCHCWRGTPLCSSLGCPAEGFSTRNLAEMLMKTSNR